MNPCLVTKGGSGSKSSQHQCAHSERACQPNTPRKHHMPYKTRSQQSLGTGRGEGELYTIKNIMHLATKRFVYTIGVIWDNQVSLI